MRLSEKVKLYQTIVAQISKAVNLEATLREQRADEAEIRRVERKADELAKQAARLRRNLTKRWRGNASDLIVDVRRIGSKVQNQIRQIERTRKLGERVVKALGHIDDLVDVAKGVLAGVA